MPRALLQIAGISGISKVWDPGELGKDEFRFGPQQARDPVADQGVVILDVDAEPFENAVRETSRRHVNAVADEDVAARFGETQKRR